MIEIDKIIDWIKKYFVESNGQKAVIGISGGKDSTVACGLLCQALGPENVIAVKMPCGHQEDLDVANAVIDYFNIPIYNRYEINIEDACEGLYSQLLDDSIDIVFHPNIPTNLPARIRMTVLYAIASTCSGRVVNTGNASEAYVGYTTKFGDGAGDFAILSNYTVREVKEIGKYLNIPDIWLEKIPTDGMSNKTDEENLGFTYDVLDDFLIDKKLPNIDTCKLIEYKHKENKHKQINIPTCPFFEKIETDIVDTIYRRFINHDFEDKLSLS